MVTKPLWPNGRFGVPQITPYTYRDGQTLLELITSLRDHVVEQLHPSLQHAIDQLVADVEAEYNTAHDRYVDGVQEFQRIHDAFMSDVNASLIALNDTAVSDLVDDATSLLGGMLRRLFEPEGEVHRNTYDRMGVVVPDELTFQALQAAADDAAATGKRLWASGELETDETLVLRCDADLGQLEIQYTGYGTAVQVGEPGEYTMQFGGTLPRVTTAFSTSGYWNHDSVGIKLINNYSCLWTVPHVHGFGVGLDMVGDVRGCGYNTIYVGHLSSNRINQRLIGINGGWTNQNTMIGGRLSYLTSFGVDLDGTRHIELTPSPNRINNNVWLNPSIEGNVPQYHLLISGSYNQFLNARFEATPPRVMWTASNRNQILYGYGAQSIEEHGERGAGDIVVNSQVQEFIGSSLEPLQILAQAGGRERPVTGIYEYSGWRNPLEEYSVLQSTHKTEYKLRDDPYPRMRILHPNGRILFGNGQSEPEKGIGAYGAAFEFRGMSTTGATPRNGNTGAQDTPATPQGYLDVYVDGSRAYIPYYRP